MNTLLSSARCNVHVPHRLSAARAAAAAPPPPPPHRTHVGAVPHRLAASRTSRRVEPRTRARAARVIAAAALTEQELAKRALRLDTFEPQAVDQVRCLCVRQASSNAAPASAARIGAVCVCVLTAARACAALRRRWRSFARR
jgi:hypothetical protein